MPIVRIDAPCGEPFSFGNGYQAIEVARARFDRFFQIPIEIVG
jgi:hypothetical protein